jgi:FkbM family methyltransferase
MVVAVAKAVSLRGIRQAVRALLPQPVLNWREARYFREYGEVEMRLVDLLCRRDEDAIDVGANWGGYVHFMQRYARRVVAFEPVPEFASLLRAKFAKNVTVEQIALSDCSGEVGLHIPVIDGVRAGGCSTISPEASATYAAHEVVPVRMGRIDDVYKGTVGFIKIDAEGHEQAVLNGAVATIRRCRPRMLVEIEERMSLGAIARTTTFFAALDYRGYYVHAGELHEIERFSVADLQKQADVPIMTMALRERMPLVDYVCNFIFLPLGEREEPARSIRGRLACL